MKSKIAPILALASTLSLAAALPARKWDVRSSTFESHGQTLTFSGAVVVTLVGSQLSQPAGEKWKIEAQSAQAEGTNIAFHGQVVAKFGTLRFSADEMVLNSETGILRAGAATMTKENDPSGSVVGEDVEIDTHAAHPVFHARNVRVTPTH